MAKAKKVAVEDIRCNCDWEDFKGKEGYECYSEDDFISRYRGINSDGKVIYICSNCLQNDCKRDEDGNYWSYGYGEPDYLIET